MYFLKANKKMNENYQTMATILMLEMGSVSERSILIETSEFDYLKPVVQPRLALYPSPLSFECCDYRDKQSLY